MKQISGNWEIVDGDTSWTVDNVGQYTGLKDKNGKEIYEGDILLDDSIKAKCSVVFGSYPTLKDDYGYEERSPKFCVLWSDKSGYSEINKYDIEVIGNIHETPELLK